MMWWTAYGYIRPREKQIDVQTISKLVYLLKVSRSALVCYFHETLSPVVKPMTVRLVLYIVVQHNWPIHQLFVKDAFLQGKLDEVVYMSQPKDLSITHSWLIFASWRRLFMATKEPPTHQPTGIIPCMNIYLKWGLYEQNLTPFYLYGSIWM